MSTTPVQTGNTGATSINSGVAGTVLPANTRLGDCVALYIVTANTTVSAVSSGIGTFTHVTGNTQSTTFVAFEWWICLKSTGAAKTVTVTTTGGTQYGAYAIEFPFVGSNVVAATPQNASSGSPSLTLTNGVGQELFAGVSAGSGISALPGAPWADTGFSPLGSAFGNQDGEFTNATATNQSVAWTSNPAAWGTAGFALTPVFLGGPGFFICR